jgi:superfamily I DNA/RNA helicase
VSFVPSRYQQTVFDFIERGTGDGIVEAVAGSGKTTTLVQAAHRLTVKDSVFLAFNKHIAEELAQRLAGTGTAARTFHSVGNQLVAGHLGKVKVDGRKYKKMVRDHFDRASIKASIKADVTAAATKLVDLARVSMIDLEADAERSLIALCAHHNIEPFDEALAVVPTFIRRGERDAEIYKSIDFTDMIYLPLKWGLQPSRVAFCFVDECQDLNAMQLQLALRMRAEGGRMLFVGDARQAIYGFAGADAESFNRIKQVTRAQVLPLSICYRCPSSHVDLARAIIPQIEARDNAPAGEIINADEDKLPEIVKEGDLILCRLTAPLVTWCIKLIQRKVAARVRGRDIGEDLCEILKKLEGTLFPFEYAELPRYLNEYQSQQLAYLAKRDADESQIQSMIDRVECLQVCYSNFPNATTVTQLCAEIDGLFSDERSGVWLSTIHKAKGLENERVFILKPDKLPLIWEGQRSWQYEQELNLTYVAVTRAKQSLIILGKTMSVVKPTPLNPLRDMEWDTGVNGPFAVETLYHVPDGKDWLDYVPKTDAKPSVPAPVQQPLFDAPPVAEPPAPLLEIPAPPQVQIVRIRSSSARDRVKQMLDGMSDEELDLIGDLIAATKAARAEALQWSH